MGITLVALVPTFVLWTIERRARQSHGEPAEPALGEVILEAA